MASTRASCPKCGSELNHVSALAERHLVGPLRIVGAVLRIFVGHCPDHGKMFARHPHVGHHSTRSAAELKARYNKQKQQAIKKALPTAEAQKFSRALEGRYLPTSEEICTWDELTNPALD